MQRRPEAVGLSLALRLAVPLLILGAMASSAEADQRSDRRQVGHRVSRIHRDTTSHAERLAAVSAMFVGRRYQISPLGEGPLGSVDADPIARFDRFDCVTYVEQVMALAWFGKLDAAIAELQHIRYAAGQIRYGARKHIMMAQWIPQNIAAGFVRDISSSVAGGPVSYAELQLGERDFVSPLGRKLKLSRADRPLGTHRLPIIPVDRLGGLIGRIPHGTIITSIRAPRSGVPYRASHVGLVIDEGGKKVVRHAHRRRGRVVEQPLETFSREAQRWRRWPIVGFNLLAIAEHPPARPNRSKSSRSSR